MDDIVNKRVIIGKDDLSQLFAKKKELCNKNAQSSDDNIKSLKKENCEAKNIEL